MNGVIQEKERDRDSVREREREQDTDLQFDGQDKYQFGRSKIFFRAGQVYASIFFMSYSSYYLFIAFPFSIFR